MSYLSLMRGAKSFVKITRCLSFLYPNRVKMHNFYGLKQNVKQLFQFDNAPVVTLNRVFNRHVNVMGYSPQPAESVSTGENVNSTVSHLISSIEMNIESRNIVHNDQVESLLECAKKYGSLTQDQSIKLLSYTGSLMSNTLPAERKEIFENVWEEMQNLGVECTLPHYNTALKVKIENGNDFIAADFLAVLDQHHIAPDRTTFQLLIQHYCEQGDIASASTVLEHMKSENLPVDEQVFNSLIRGYLKKGEIKQAKEIVQTMKELDLDTTIDTYKEFMFAYAEKGDMEGFMQSISEAVWDGALLHHEPFFESVFKMAENGHTSLIPKILGVIVKRRGFRIAANNMVTRLCSHGHFEAAKLIYSDPDFPNVGHTLVRAMIRNEKPLADVMELLEEVKFANEESEMESAVFNFDNLMHNITPEYGLELLAELKSKDYSLGWRAYLLLGQQIKKITDADRLYKLLPMYKYISEEKDRLSNLYYRIYNPLLNAGESHDEIRNKLVDVGYTDSDVDSLLFMELITQSKAEEALKLANEKSLEAEATVSSLVEKHCLQTEDWRVLIKLLGRAKVSDPWKSKNSVNNVVRHIMQTGELSEEEYKELAELLFSQNICFESRHLDDIMINLNSKGVPPELVKKLEGNLLYSNAEFHKGSVEQFKKATLEETKVIYEEAKERGVSLIDFQRMLLLKLCNSGEVEETIKLKAELDKKGYFYTAADLVQLGNFYSRYAKDLEAALDTKTTLDNHYPAHEKQYTFILNLAHLLVTQGKLDDAKAVIEEHGNKVRERSRDAAVHNADFQLVSYCERLMAACIKHGDPYIARNMMNMLFNLGYIKRGSFALISPLIRAYINSGTSESLVSLCEEFSSEYDHIPLYNQVFRRLINEDDPEKLQKVVDAATRDSASELPVLNELIVAFAECGKMEHALKLVQAEGVFCWYQVYQHHCRKYVERKKVQEMERLVTVTKKLRRSDRKFMLDQLTRVYGAVNDLDKLEGMISMFKEEGLEPNQETLKFISDTLSSNGREVSFTVPAAKTPKSKVDRTPIKASSKPIKVEQTDDSWVTRLLSTNPRNVFHKSLLGLGEKDPQERQEALESVVKYIQARKPEYKTVLKGYIGYLLLNSEFEQAKVILQENPDYMVNFYPWVNELKIEKQEDLMLNIISFLKSERPQAPLGIVYSFLISSACEPGNLTTAMEYYHAAMNDGIDNKQLGLPCLQKLEALLKANDQEIPWNSELFLLKERSKNWRRETNKDGNLTDVEARELGNALINNPEFIPELCTADLLKKIEQEIPDLLEKLEKQSIDLIEQDSEKRKKLSMSLISYYIYKEDFEKAKSILKMQKTPFSIRYGSLVKDIKEQGREDLLQQLVSLGKLSDFQGHIPPYSSLIQLKCEQNNWQSALEYYNEALSDGIEFQKLGQNTLELLESRLKENNQEVPWDSEPLKTYTKKRQNQYKPKKTKSRSMP